MAADREPDWLCSLPSPWTLGVCEDGRVFFINDEAQSTSWLHPVSGEAAVTGHRKTADLPSGWEEGYTFEGARCFINHNERKVTCKHPVSGVPSQDNCIFVVNEQAAPQAPSEQGSSGREKKERPVSEASNVTGGSDYSSFPRSPTTSITTANTTTTTLSTSTASRPSRSSKKLHNFGKRSNSIKRNINAPVVKNGWIYKQDSTGMKLWKKRWFVLSDLCLFYYRDEKEDSILGSILLPSFHISMLSVDDHISKKYAFKATHPNMRTYYFCTDSAKEMELWMKVMTDAALGHTEPVRRLEKLKVDPSAPHELNNQLNHRVLTRPVIQNNERNRELQRQHSLSGVDGKGPKDSDPSSGPKLREYYTLQRDGQRYPGKKDGVGYLLQKEQEVHKNPEQHSAPTVEEKYSVALMEEKYAPPRDREKYLVTKDGEKHALQRVGDRHTLQRDLQRDLQRYVPQKEVRRSLSLKDTERYSTLRATDHRYGTIHVVDKHGALKEVKKYSTLREGDKYAIMRDAEKYATLKDWEKLGFQRDTSIDRPPTRISSIKLQPAQAAAIAAAVSASRQSQVELSAHKPAQVNSSGTGEQQTDSGSSEVELSALLRAPLKSPLPAPEPEKSLNRSDSMQQLQDWVRTHRTSHTAEEDAKSVTSYQTLPRNMPSQRAHLVPRYPEGYRTMPRNCLMRPDSICSTAGSVYDRGLPPASSGSGSATAEKRRSMRDDTMWQLYEWQQRQAFSRQSVAPPTVTHYGTLPNTKTTGSLSIPPSPSHGSLALFKPVSATPQPQGAQLVPNSSQSEATSPSLRAELTLERRHRTALTKQQVQPVQYGYSSDRRSTAAPVSSHSISAQSLQGKTPEELTLLLIKLRRQQAELNTLREHTVAQLTALGLEAPNAKTDVLSHHLQRNLVYLDSQTKENEPLIFMIHTMIENSAPRPQLYQQVPPEEAKDVECSEEADIDTKLSVLCEQDKAVRTLQDKLQQLHREKHTLETAFLSASQELSEQRCDGASTQSLMQQRDVLQNGLLSTCRELSRVTTELERSWRDYDWMEADVTRAKSNLLEQLEALGSPQTEPPSQQHIQIQKELWRIQDVMEVLSKNKPQRSTEGGFPGSKPLSSQQKNEEAISVLLRPLPPQYHDSSQRAPPEPPRRTQPGGRPPTHTQCHEERKTSTRNGTNNQAPDYRLYKSEPELTTVKEEGDEAHTEDRDKTDPTMQSEDTSVPQGAPSSAHIVPPRTKSPISPPESSTIASYVTLRKGRKPESRSDRPRSAFDQFGFMEREVCRTRMSVEEQLERMRRNQEASTLREKKKENPLSRSPSFNKLKPSVQLQGEDVPQHRTPLGVDGLQDEASRTDQEVCHRKRVGTGDLGPGPQQEEIVTVQPLPEQDKSRAPETFCSLPNPPDNSSFQIVGSETSSPEPPEEPGGPQQASRKENLEKPVDLYSQLKAGDQKHNNNNNILTAQTFTLVSSDT